MAQRFLALLRLRERGLIENAVPPESGMHRMMQYQCGYNLNDVSYLDCIVILLEGAIARNLSPLFGESVGESIGESVLLSPSLSLLSE